VRRTIAVAAACLALMVGGASRSRAQDVLPAAGPELPAELSFALGYGFGFPELSTLLFTGPAPLAQGFVLDELIRKVFIRRAIHERIFLDFDYDAGRGSGFLATEPNTYSLQYLGPEDELLRELSLGNRHLGIPGSGYVPLDAGNPNSFALRGRAARGGWGLEGLVRYGMSLQGTRRFRGGRRVVETELLDVQYLRARYFLLPDSGVDEAGLRVYRSSDRISDLEIDGKRFALLVRGTDYRFDNPRGQIALSRSLLSGEELAVYYEKGGTPVGSVTLGRNAIIDGAGLRDDFDASAYPEYFDGSATVLYLRKGGLNSYWEMRSAYPLEELPSEAVARGVSVELLFTDNGAVNPNYGELLERFRMDPEAGAILFGFEDPAGFYPRPFPGEFPFTHPATPDNPFAPDNPVYGGLSYPGPDASINTLRLRYAVSTDSFFLDYDLVAGSVRVTVDGVPLSPSLYTVDTMAGVITFDPGVLSPSSLVEVTYSYTPFAGGRQELLSALGIGYSTDGFQARSLTAFRYPIEEPLAPYVGEEREADLRSSLAARAVFGAPPGSEGFHAELAGEAALAVRSPNAKGEAIVADMEDDRRYLVSVYEEEWLLGSRSQILPQLPLPGLTEPSSPVSLDTRGELRYENYWQSSLLSGDTLRELAWDNSGNPRFSYTEKAGPYNTADHPPGGEGRSLVLDFAFPAGSDNAYVTAATALTGSNLAEYRRFNISFRGAGISGEAVRIHVEALRVYQEDLDGDDVLDGESSSDQAGFAITPLGGGPTVIGTDRFGQANGRLDSEDLDGNGYLDPLGPFLSDEEAGVPLAGEGATQAHLAELGPGSEDWRVVSLDIGHLIAASPEVFQDLQGLRITITPASATTPTSVSGKVLINRMWFAASGLHNDTPASLSLREVSAAEDPVVAANLFSDSYPEVYQELHGSPAYRERRGFEEQVLVCRFEPPLPAGERASVSRRFGYTADLSAYRELRLYLYRPAGESYPAAAVFELSLRASEQERLEADLPSAAFGSGWNEIRVSLEEGFGVAVNGTQVGALSPTGTLGVLSRVSQVRFGLRAEGAELTEGFEFWLDEWHLRSPRIAVEGAALAEASLGYRGTLLGIGGVPVLSDVLLAGRYEHTGGGFEGTPGWREDRYSGALDMGLLGVLSAGLSADGTSRRPLEAGSAGPAAGTFEFREGRRTSTVGMRLGLDTGLPYLPVLEHGYRRTDSQEDALALTQADYALARADTVAESLTLTERFQPADWLSQSYSYSRSWLFEGATRWAADTGALLDEARALALTQVHAAGAVVRWNGGRLSVSLSRDETLDIPGPELPPELFSSYGSKMAALFLPVRQAYPDGLWDTRADAGELFLSVPRRRHVGASLGLQASYRGWNYDPAGTPAASSRDAEVSEALSLSVPISPDGDGRFQLIPSLTRSYRGTYRQATEELKEARLLWESGRQLLFWPFYYLNPCLDSGRLNELAAVDVLAGAPEVTGSSSARLETSLALDASLRTGLWYVPSRLGLSVTGDTSRDGSAYAQTRSLRTRLGLDIPLVPKRRGPAPAGSDRLGLDAGYVLRWDYARKLRVHEVSSRAFVLLGGPLPGELSGQHTLSYSRERQAIGDSALELVPGRPDLEPPVGEEPDRDLVTSALGLEYRWEQTLQRRPRVSRWIPVPLQATQTVSHTERLAVENQILIMDRAKTTSTGAVPLRIVLEHETLMGVSENMHVQLALRTMGGLQERIEADRSFYEPAWGLEARLQVVLSF